MRSLSRIAVAAVGGVMALLAGCASGGYHYSQLSGNRHFRAPIDTYPVAIVRVDGKDNTFRPATVDAGVRQVTVQGPPGGGSSIGEERTITLNVAPCTRYYLVAVKANSLSSDFTVRVDFEESIGGCTPPPAA